MIIVDIDRAGRLYDTMAVARVAAGSTLIGLILFFVGVAGQEVYGGYSWPVLGSFLLERLPWVALMALIAYGMFWSAGPAARLGMIGLAAYAAFWIVEAGFQIWRVRDDGVLWVAAGLFRLVAVSWIALEVIVSLWPALRAKRADLGLLQEPSGLRSLLGLPPALSYLTAGRRATAALFILAAFCFSLAIQQTTALMTSADVLWQTAADACQRMAGVAERQTCINGYGSAEVFGQFVVWPLTFVVAIVVGRWLRGRARRAARDRATAAMKAMDTQPPDPAFAPILFLRTFRDDQVRLPDARTTPLGWLFGFVRGPQPLDHLLVEEFVLYGPTVALAQASSPTPGEVVFVVPDHGVTRYLTAHETWKSEVARLAELARAIVMVADDQPQDGVRWELEHLRTAGHLHKTIFLVAPACAQAAANAAAVGVISQSQPLAAGLAPLPAGQRLLGLFTGDNGAASVAASSRFTRSDYHMALRWYFRSRFGQ